MLVYRQKIYLIAIFEIETTNELVQLCNFGETILEQERILKKEANIKNACTRYKIYKSHLITHHNYLSHVIHHQKCYLIVLVVAHGK